MNIIGCPSFMKGRWQWMRWYQRYGILDLGRCMYPSSVKKFMNNWLLCHGTAILRLLGVHPLSDSGWKRVRVVEPKTAALLRESTLKNRSCVPNRSLLMVYMRAVWSSVLPGVGKYRDISLNIRRLRNWLTWFRLLWSHRAIWAIAPMSQWRWISCASSGMWYVLAAWVGSWSDMLVLLRWWKGEIIYIPYISSSLASPNPLQMCVV